MAAVDQQIREQRVELGYHRVIAPEAGVVGDIPVRVGDRVTNATILTTVDDNQGLEVYLQVPVQQAPSLSRRAAGTHRRRSRCGDRDHRDLVRGAVGRSADAIGARQGHRSTGRASAPINSCAARVVWRSAPGLTIPLVSVTRINGRFFAFVAEAGEGGATVARQRPIELGPLTGNDYVVARGPVGRRTADRVGRAEDRRRRPGGGDARRRGAPAAAAAPPAKS